MKASESYLRKKTLREEAGRESEKEISIVFRPPNPPQGPIPFNLAAT
jgi:hypothetical protein